MKNILLLLSSCYLLILPNVVRTQTTLNWEDKVDISLLEEYTEHENLDFIIILKNQATISTQHLNIKSEKGEYLYDKLSQWAAKDQKSLLDFLVTENALINSYWIVNVIHARGNIGLLEKVAKRDDVGFISSNPSVKMEYPKQGLQIAPRDASPEWGITQIKADQVWDMDIRGEYAIIGGQDTGYDWEHPALKEKYLGWDSNTNTVDHNHHWHDAIHELNDLHGGGSNPCGLNSLIPCDDGSHGTHTMGTMVGGDADNATGVAPNARWIGCRNMERGYGTPVTYMECFQWFVAPTNLDGESPMPDRSPHVINNSWSCPEMEGCTPANFAMMQQVVKHVKQAGIAVVVSAGNSGPQCNTISTPAAIFEESFTIGATDDRDSIAGFSSRGVVLADNSQNLKPNVVAPGVNIRSSVPGGGYATFNGTSMAGPHVAGTVALVISSNPLVLSGDVERIEKIIEITATALFDQSDCQGVLGSMLPNTTYGYGRIDAKAAVDLAMKEGIKFNNEGVFVYPNPSNGLINFQIKNHSGKATFNLFNMQGQIVLEQIVNINTFTPLSINLHTLTQGVYAYKIAVGEEILSGKVVVY